MTEPAIGYIGLDHHHYRPYLDTIDRLPAEVTCLCEPDDSAEIDPPGDVPIYRDYRTMFDREAIDIAWITASNKRTPDVVSAAIDSDIDVYTEKPVARTAADLEPLLETVDTSSVDVCVSYPWRSHPIALDLRTHVEDGFFGQPFGFNAQFVASKPEFRDTGHYLFDREESRGGIVQWLGVHWIDLVPWILQDPIERVNAQMSSHAPSLDIEDSATIMLETRSGASGSLECGYYLRDGRYDTYLSAYGDEGHFCWDPTGTTFGFDDETTLVLESTTEDWNSAPRRMTVYEYGPDRGYGGTWGLNFARQFLEARNGTTSLPATLEDAHQVLRVLDAIYKSAEVNNWVEVES
jgi:predicted dehydrogenase